MAEILAEAGRITELGPEISGKIAFGLQSSYGRATGGQPTRFVASASQLTDLGDDDLVVVQFSRTDLSTGAGPLPVVALSRA
ncbi:MAG TPA: hypothetical protein VMH35_02980 [Streptosporangiaceae bacterium]|nr:hypothetical protein [Streptosporangiaceae bacterium]